MQMYLKKQLNKFFVTYKKYREITFINFFLRIISFFYFIGYKIRLYLYKINILKPHKLRAVVISVGNITTGGTGKTSVTIELAKYFLRSGFKVAVLSRGYKKKTNSTNNNGAILVSDGHDILTNYEISGDEPLLIAKKVPKAFVLVGKDKVKLGLSAIKLGAQILILDDGFQHIRINRDENILLIDCKNPFDNGCLIPSGNLRELPDSIKRATSIILTNLLANKGSFKDETVNKIKRYSRNSPITTMKYKIKQFTGINIKKTLSTQEAANLKVIAFSGIGNPQSFIDLLKENNILVAEHITYPDHYNYSFEDLEEIIQLARKNNVDNIITTEKDAVKLEYLCESVPLTVWACILEIIWDEIDPFDKILANKPKWINQLLVHSSV